MNQKPTSNISATQPIQESSGAKTDPAPSKRRSDSKDIDYPPYVQSTGGIAKLFSAIRTAAVPPKFTQDFLETKLGLTSSSYRAFIPFLKRLGFLDQSNVPTKDYRDFRGPGDQSKKIMARLVKHGYKILFEANEYANDLDRESLIAKLRSMSGASAEDRIIPSVATSFQELCKLADFGIQDDEVEVEKEMEAKYIVDSPRLDGTHRETNRNIGFSYTINLNLPATTDVEVFNAIFRSLKEHLLDS